MYFKFTQKILIITNHNKKLFRKTSNQVSLGNAFLDFNTDCSERRAQHKPQIEKQKFKENNFNAPCCTN